MARLLYYFEEQIRFSDAYKEVLSRSLATLFFEKLKSHYKFSQVLYFGGNKGRGNCSSYRVRLSDSPTLGLLVHEVAHAIQFRKIRLGLVENTHRWHTKKHTRIMKGVLKYINSNRVSWIVMQELKNEKVLRKALLVLDK